MIIQQVADPVKYMSELMEFVQFLDGTYLLLAGMTVLSLIHCPMTISCLRQQRHFVLV